ncbi:hypothetical protein [Methylobacterium sp. B1]|uniref:hypothetical protein n=1 Tax=Methylobacterium sp. B1 TaxID=91459 RepID=UPI0005BA4025|nr:hypothetical protein [Methylobacterium sp. B1]
MCEVPIEIRRGNNDPAVIWEFANADGSPADLSGSVFVLTVAWPAIPLSAFNGVQPAASFSHSSDPVVGDGVLIIDAAAGRVTWPYSLAESELIPRGLAQGALGPNYDLTRTLAGRTRSWAGGPVLIRSYLP